MRELFELSNLKQDWDGYGSPPITTDATRVAWDIIGSLSREDVAEKPTLSPVTGGGIVIMWEADSLEWEVEILPDGEVQVDVEESERVSFAAYRDPFDQRGIFNYHI